MIEEAIIELTRMLIEQDIKDRQEGTEIVSMAKADIIRENIKLLKLIERLIQ